MKRKLISIIMTIFMILGAVSYSGKKAEAASVIVTYRTHVQTYGWQDWKANGAVSGTVGMAKRLEGIEIRVTGANLGVQYQTHVQTYGWQGWVSNGTMSGTSGQSKRLEAIRIRLTGDDVDKYDIYYRVHAQHFGWMAWVKNGASAGTAGYAYRLEGIQIQVVEKDAAIDAKAEGVTSKNTSGYLDKNASSESTSDPGTEIPVSDSFGVTYRTHVQTYGWQAWKKNGEMSGTSGQAKRLEGINIRLVNAPYSGGIMYRTHVQTYGWQDWKYNGDMSGTSGKAKRLEGIEIKLTGEMANHYDVVYRTHVQTYGWQEWKKNGEMSGTSGQAKRLEGIEIKLVAKQSGTESPDPIPDTGNDDCVHNWVEKTHVEKVHHTQTFMISEAWDEHITASTWKCYGYETCGFWVFQSELKEYADKYCDGNRMTAFIILHKQKDSDCPIGGYGTGYDMETGETVHHDAEYYTDEWDTDETVVDYTYCTKCGKRK